QTLVQRSPPFSHFGVSKIRKLAPSGPNVTFHKIIVTTTAEVFVFLTFFKHPIIFVYFYTRINHHNSFKTVISQIENHLFRVRKILFVPGKTAVSVHIIYVQINGITGNLPLSELFRYMSYIRFRIIAPSALVVAYSPQWRKIMSAG